MAFGDINREEIEKENQEVEKELHSYKKAETVTTTPNKVKDLAGMVLGSLGTLGLVVAGVGASLLLLDVLVSWTGLAAIWIVLISMGVGFLGTGGSLKLITGSWMPQQGVLV